MLLKFVILEDPGVATVWLLATIGCKSGHRKIKQDVIKTAIPETCARIGTSQLPLRMSSNLMYGVTLLYKQKVEYCYSEATATRTRLYRDFAFQSTATGVLVPSTTPYKRDHQVFLEEDPLFDVAHGLIQPFDDTCRARQSRASEGSGELQEDSYADASTVQFEFDQDGMMVDIGSHPAHNVVDSDLDYLDINNSINQSVQRDYKAELEATTNQLLGDFKISAVSDTGAQADHSPTATIPRKRVLVDKDVKDGVSRDMPHRRLIIRPRASHTDFIRDELAREMCLLRTCYAYLLGVPVSSPARYYHFFDDSEIEVSRNARTNEFSATLKGQIEISRRAASANSDSAFDNLHPSRYDEVGEDTLDISFPDVTITSHNDDSAAEDESGTNASQSGNGQSGQTVAKFYQFVQARAQSVGSAVSATAVSSGIASRRMLSFAELVPREEISRKVAAASFASLLVLATNSKVELKQTTNSIDIYTECE
jgi:hypothetical protein